jgi:hypothetical protein
MVSSITTDLKAEDRVAGRNGGTLMGAAPVG